MDDQQRPLPDDFFKDWKDREALAEGMIPLIGKLYRQSNISTYMYGNSMVNKSVTDIMQEHRFVRQVEHNEISEFDTFPMLEGITKLQIGPAHIDLGKMVVKFQSGNGGGQSLEAFLADELSDIIGSEIKPLPEPQDIVLYGFGRIGRLIARILVDKAGSGDVLRLRAIVIRKGKVNHDLEKRAALLRTDSVHGPFKGTVRVLEDQDTLVINGNPVKIIYANSPAEVDYTQYGISNALIVDNTGVWKDTEGLSGHLRPGASKVLLTAPAGDDIPNIVYGVNHDQITEDRKIISAASCTTNAIVPVLKCLLDEFGINSGHVETVHAYTNDQNLIDNYHKGGRRGRSAALNMVLSS
ncbi:MAG: glyceraldehyde-3-phosphate dehydrogenase, partial [Porticoccaceae bacterium]|nr:glyceraldehyde-3-phosphate dehydrogenase [Porticoccaceae bacterium]